MLKATPRAGGGDAALLPPPPSLTGASSVRSLDAMTQPTPRSERMMDRLRDGLGEYIRLYNPVSTNWRKMNASVAQDQQQQPSQQQQQYGRHSVDLGHTAHAPSRSGGESADLVPPMLFHKKTTGGNIPRLHILHSDSESDDDEAATRHLGGSVRSMPNLSYRGNITFRGPDTYRAPGQGLDSTRLVAPPSERSLSTISSDDEDVYTSRRQQMRQTLKLMGASGGDSASGGGGGNVSKRVKLDSTPRLKRDRKSRIDSKTGTGQKDNSNDTNSSKKDSTQTKKLVHQKSRASLDVITESHATPESQTPVMTPATNEKKASLTSQDDVVGGAKRGSQESSFQKRGSRHSLARSMSRKSLDEGVTSGAASLSKKGSVAALRARRRRVSLARRRTVSL